jgi:hypothetical protein
MTTTTINTSLSLIPTAFSAFLMSVSVPLILEPVSFSAHFVKIETTQAVFYAGSSE